MMGWRSRKTVPAVYMRGGSSKAIFFHEKDIPAPGAMRDRLLKRLMGTPDPLQIDGMGGTRSVTSKIAIVRSSTRAGADVDYTFVQVGVRDDSISYDANCGNVSSAVGPFAIQEGLVAEFRSGVSFQPGLRAQEVRIYNTNTDKLLISHVPIDQLGHVIEKGDFAMAAVPGTGAPISLDFRATIGASRNTTGILPTGNSVDTIELRDRCIPITVCDVGNPIVFVHAGHVGITGREGPTALTADAQVMAMVNEVRGRAAQMMGLCDDWVQADTQCPFVPALIAISSPTTDDGHVSGRLFVDGQCHESMTASGAICTAACSRIPNTLVWELLGGEARKQDIIRLAHPVGVIPVLVKAKTRPGGDPASPNPYDFETLSFVRTARRIFDGRLYIPDGFWDGD